MYIFGTNFTSLPGNLNCNKAEKDNKQHKNGIKVKKYVIYQGTEEIRTN